ncbi:hypothetical protein HV234_21000 [Klebsiella grimontii]|uniref:Uncharacterized protein n=1 Tax=Klebsiella grimontii TaxID=2058152 RepID=A0ABD7AM89_9ENTR|nr:hypothetical protein [Klebsiella grimontii]QLO53836.1 hypothetical protein HV234_21000 [Klebsiella grimontii]
MAQGSIEGNCMINKAPALDNGLRLFEKNGSIGVCTMDGRPINGLISVIAHSECGEITRATIEVEVFSEEKSRAIHTANRHSHKKIS